jgi:hypothetical protein
MQLVLIRSSPSQAAKLRSSKNSWMAVITSSATIGAPGAGWHWLAFHQALYI